MGTILKVDNGMEMVYPLSYGRAELGDIVTKADNDDVPIKPGETIILSAGKAPYWEKGVLEKRWPESTKSTAEIQVLSFGDGTGYFGTQSYPPAGRRQAVNDKMAESPRARARPNKRSIGKLGAQSRSSSTFNQPTFMSANFFVLGNSD